MQVMSPAGCWISRLRRAGRAHPLSEDSAFSKVPMSARPASAFGNPDALLRPEKDKLLWLAWTPIQLRYHDGTTILLDSDGGGDSGKTAAGNVQYWW